MVDLQPMTAKEAFDKGYGMKPNQDPNGDGYEVTYPDGYKSWSPKEVADAAYFPIQVLNHMDLVLVLTLLVMMLT